ncbi:MAG: sigma-70 family RNA polymerase sigma factor [Gemmataceae bacterium]
MSSGSSFNQLIGRVKAGDDTAATELVRRYEPAIRRSARLRLNPRLRRVCDSLDLCQAALGSFFVRAAAGQYELGTPEQFLKLLATMVRNKLSKLARRERALCRDHRRVAAGSPEDHEVSDDQASPVRQVAARELLEETQRRLSAEERLMLELRQQGLDWASIATTVGGSPEARRKQLARSVERVAAELGLESGHV